MNYSALRLTGMPVLVAAAIVLASPDGRPQTVQAAPHMQCPSGTFLQVTAADTSRPGAWTDFAADLHALGTSSIFVQWTVRERTVFLPVGPRSGFVAGASPPLPELLRLADERDLAIWVGLIEDPQFWTAVAADARTVDAYLQGPR
ncbi:hypothetical protein BH24ACI4_BH24ACI4_22820 [soil metagenome]